MHRRDAEELVDACRALTAEQWVTIGTRHGLINDCDDLLTVLRHSMAPAGHGTSPTADEVREQFADAIAFAKEQWPFMTHADHTDPDQHQAFLMAVVAAAHRECIPAAAVHRMTVAVASAVGNVELTSAAR